MTPTLDTIAAILRDLATRDPYGEDRAGRTYCILCGGSEETVDGLPEFRHEERCCWWRARRVVGVANDG